MGRSFSPRDLCFVKLVADWQADNLIFRWSNGWSSGSLHSAASDGHPRFAVRGGMNSLPRYLAAGLVRQGATLAANVKAVAAAPNRAGWQVSDDTGRTWHSRSLVLTPPAPHSLALWGCGSPSPRSKGTCCVRIRCALPVRPLLDGRHGVAASTGSRPAPRRRHCLDRRQSTQGHFALRHRAHLACRPGLERRPL